MPSLLHDVEHIKEGLVHRSNKLKQCSGAGPGQSLSKPWGCMPSSCNNLEQLQNSTGSAGMGGRGSGARVKPGGGACLRWS